MRQETLCLIVNDSQLLLGLKKRGFAEGKWNGFGGKVQENESLEAAAIREVVEEVGLIIKPTELQKVGELDFIFLNHLDWNRTVHIFMTRTWQGEPQESEEMRPRWFETSALPFSQMWNDDPFWLPLVLAGKKIKGIFHFSDDHGTIENHELKEVPDFEIG